MKDANALHRKGLHLSCLPECSLVSHGDDIYIPNDTVDDMDIGDEDGDRDGSPVRTTNTPSSSFENTNEQPEIRTFSYYVVVDSRKTVLRGRKGLWTRDVKSKLKR